MINFIYTWTKATLPKPMKGVVIGLWLYSVQFVQYVQLWLRWLFKMNSLFQVRGSRFKLENNKVGTQSRKVIVILLCYVFMLALSATIVCLALIQNHTCKREVQTERKRTHPTSHRMREKPLYIISIIQYWGKAQFRHKNLNGIIIEYLNNLVSIAHMLCTSIHTPTMHTVV